MEGSFDTRSNRHSTRQNAPTPESLPETTPRQEKAGRIEKIRTHPDLKKALNFLSTYKSDPEAAEARDILFSVLER